MEPRDQLALVELEVLLSQYLESYTQTGSLEAIKSNIAAHIHDLLGAGMPKLMSFMYLVDVKEELFKTTLANTIESDWPKALTLLVIERLLEKVYTRLQNRK